MRNARNDNQPSHVSCIQLLLSVAVLQQHHRISHVERSAAADAPKSYVRSLLSSGLSIRGDWESISLITGVAIWFLVIAMWHL